MNTQWLLSNGNDIIKYHITHDQRYLEGVFDNNEVTYWLNLFLNYSESKLIDNIHGSHDYRMENILGKLWILGFNSDIEWFDQKISYLIDFLSHHIDNPPNTGTTFEKIYQKHDYETVLCSFLPYLGYGNTDIVGFIADKRINSIHSFICQNRYDIYIDSSGLKGVRKAWKPYIINPDLYSDGNIKLPSIHDLFLFAGVYRYLNLEQKCKVDAIVQWILDDRYKNLKNGYGYFYATDGDYNVKSIVRTIRLQNTEALSQNDTEMQSLLMNMYILSHFEAGLKSNWFNKSKQYLEQYKDKEGLYKYPSSMLLEKKDYYFTSGGHMNPGVIKTTSYRTILSIFWNMLIFEHNSDIVLNERR